MEILDHRFTSLHVHLTFLIDLIHFSIKNLDLYIDTVNFLYVSICGLTPLSTLHVLICDSYEML